MNKHHRKGVLKYNKDKQDLAHVLGYPSYDVAILYLYLIKKWSLVKIANLFGVTYAAVSYRIRYLGYGHKLRSVKSCVIHGMKEYEESDKIAVSLGYPDFDTAITQMYEEGKYCKDIAIIFNKSLSFINYRLRRYLGVTLRGRGPAKDKG